MICINAKLLHYRHADVVAWATCVELCGFWNQEMGSRNRRLAQQPPSFYIVPQLCPILDIGNALIGIRFEIPNSVKSLRIFWPRNRDLIRAIRWSYWPVIGEGNRHELPPPWAALKPVEKTSLQVLGKYILPIFHLLESASGKRIFCLYHWRLWNPGTKILLFRNLGESGVAWRACFLPPSRASASKHRCDVSKHTKRLLPQRFREMRSRSEEEKQAGEERSGKQKACACT
jgi:hypothetical protein